MGKERFADDVSGQMVIGETVITVLRRPAAYRRVPGRFRHERRGTDNSADTSLPFRQVDGSLATRPVAPDNVNAPARPAGRAVGTIARFRDVDGPVLDDASTTLPDGNYVKNTHKTNHRVLTAHCGTAFQNAEQNFVARSSSNS